MRFTDLFIQRPVLASVINLLILLIGLRSLTLLDIRQYPKLENTVITVTTAYPGASSELIKGFITAPLQQAIAEAQGIDYLLSTSKQGLSTIEAHMELNYDANAAVAEIQAKVASQRNVLPAEAESPVIDFSSATQLMYMAFGSQVMSPAQITDYLLRVVLPKVQAVAGVGKAALFPNKRFAVRIWLDPNRMAALGVTANDVREALRSNNYQAAIGQTKGLYVSLNLSAATDISEEEDFRNLVVYESEGTLVRLRDIAEPKLGAEDYNSVSWQNGKPTIYVDAYLYPGANPLAVAKRLRHLMPEIRSQLPVGLKGYIGYDASTSIEVAIDEVLTALWEAVVIVLVVIFLFLGSFRAALIPAVAVPFSLIGGAILMLALGFSLNLLTLLAMVLAIGLVIDDAVMVVENIHRHIEQGQLRFRAAILGARELGLPIIAMTTTLVAVYAPIGFMRGLVGSLFIEFAFTLASAVLVSGVVALTLSPMLSSRVLAIGGKTGRFERWIEGLFTGLAQRYQSLLHHSLNYLPVTMMFSVIMLGSIYFMYVTSQQELAPTEDKGYILLQATAPQTATIDYTKAYARQIIDVFKTLPKSELERNSIMLGLGGNDPSAIFGELELTPPSERKRSLMKIQVELQQKLREVAGLEIAVFPFPSLPGSGGGTPIQFVITTAADYVTLHQVADELIKQAMTTGKFAFLNKPEIFTRPQVTLKINRDLAGDLDMQMKDIARNLATMLGGDYVNRFNLEGRSYKVIPQVARRYRLNPEMLKNYYVRTGTGALIPLSTLITLEKTVEPSKRVQFQGLNAVTVSGTMAEGVTLGEALATLEWEAKEVFPTGLGFGWDYTGESRQYAQQGAVLVTNFFFSILVIYLILAAQFESWRDSLIILVSVPMSIAGALIFITLGFATVNLYTQMGLITLIGLIAKNGILIVEFANHLQLEEGLSKREAVEKAAGIRLRPILMTTVAMIVAMIPLLAASGPGAVSRFHIGLVIASGLGIGTLFTLFVVPAVYVVLARRHEAFVDWGEERAPINTI